MAPLGALPKPGPWLLTNHAALVYDRWLSLPRVPAVAACAMAAALAVGWAAPGATAPLFALEACAILGPPALQSMRLSACRRASRALGLRAAILMPLARGQAERLFGRALPESVMRVAELHADPARSWREPGDPPAASGRNHAADRFRRALDEDYRVAADLVGQSPGWAFSVSTWHRVPHWLLDGAAVLEGPRPTWLAPLGERHRRAAQRRMFGQTLGRPVKRAKRWTTYVLLPGPGSCGEPALGAPKTRRAGE